MKAAVTGLDVVTPNGTTVESFWDNVLIGHNAITTLDRFDVSRYTATLAGQIRDFDPTETLPNRLLPQTDWGTKLALVSTDRALAAANIDLGDLDSLTTGVATASSSGGFEFSQKELKALWSQGSQHVSAYQSFAWFYAVNTGQISIRHGLRGHNSVLVNHEAAGLDAIGQARHRVLHGARLMVTGAVDASLCPWGWVGLIRAGGMSVATDPSTAYLPFDPNSTGWVPGEGGAIMVLEPDHEARSRGADVIGTIAANYSSFGGTDAIVTTIHGVAEQAGLDLQDIDVVFADATGLPHLDEQEAQALSEAFSKSVPPVTAPKTTFGRLQSGGSPVDVACALLSIRDGVIPPTINSRPPRSLPFELVTSTTTKDVEHALVLARGRGGFTSAVIVSAP